MENITACECVMQIDRFVILKRFESTSNTGAVGRLLVIDPYLLYIGFKLKITHSYRNIRARVGCLLIDFSRSLTL